MPATTRESPRAAERPRTAVKKERKTVITTLVTIFRHTTHLILSLLQRRKLRLREVSPLTQSHTAWRWQREEMSASHLLAPEPGLG